MRCDADALSLFLLDASAASELNNALLSYPAVNQNLLLLTLPDRNQHVRLPLPVISPWRKDIATTL
jgi:hypothetical protein